MKTLISSLFFDRDLVKGIEKANVSNEVLYTSLIDGKITLKEYLALVK